MVFIICMLCIGISCTSEPQAPMRVGTNVWPGYEPLYLARNLSYLNEKTVRLVEYQSNTESIRAFHNNIIEAAALTLDEAMLLVQDGLELRIILVMDISDGADVVLGKKGIKSLRDIKGKRIGAEATALGAYMLTRSLQKAGLSLFDVQIVQIPINGHEQAFKEGRVDAVVTFEPVKTKLLNAGANKLFDSSMIPGEIVDVLVVRRDYMERYPERIHHLLQAWFRALEYMQKNPGDAIKCMAVREGARPEEFAASLKGLHFPDMEENRAMLWNDSPTMLSSAEKLKKIMLDNKLLHKDIDIKPMFSAPSLRKPAL